MDSILVKFMIFGVRDLGFRIIILLVRQQHEVESTKTAKYDSIGYI